MIEHTASEPTSTETASTEAIRPETGGTLAASSDGPVELLPRSPSSRPDSAAGDPFEKKETCFG